jgi:hypothetical protein
MDSSTSMPGEMGGMPAGAPPPAGGQGDVMLSIPKAAFDAMHQVVMQLADGLNQLAQSVNAQRSEVESPSEDLGEMPMGEAGGMSAAKKPAGGKPSMDEDEEFLKSLMAEGNSKSR